LRQSLRWLDLLYLTFPQEITRKPSSYDIDIGLILSNAEEGTDVLRIGWIYSKEILISMIRPAASAQIHADDQSERQSANGITDIFTLRFGTAECVPFRSSLIAITGKAARKTTCRETQ
jgi:hypothetical protein